MSCNLTLMQNMNYNKHTSVWWEDQGILFTVVNTCCGWINVSLFYTMGYICFAKKTWFSGEPIFMKNDKTGFCKDHCVPWWAPTKVSLTTTPKSRRSFLFPVVYTNSWFLLGGIKVLWRLLIMYLCRMICTLTCSIPRVLHPYSEPLWCEWTNKKLRYLIALMNPKMNFKWIKK